MQTKHPGVSLLRVDGWGHILSNHAHFTGISPPPARASSPPTPAKPPWMMPKSRYPLGSPRQLASPSPQAIITSATSPPFPPLPQPVTVLRPRSRKEEASICSCHWHPPQEGTLVHGGFLPAPMGLQAELLWTFQIPLLPCRLSEDPGCLRVHPKAKASRKAS